MVFHSRLPSAFRLYSPALARHISRRARPAVRAARFFESISSNSSNGSRITNTIDKVPSTSNHFDDSLIYPVVGTRTYEAPRTRPYTFHIGASWAGKPVHPDDMKKVPFPPDTTIGAWRDKTLGISKDKGMIHRIDPGEDFFFIQEVCMTVFQLSFYHFGFYNLLTRLFFIRFSSLPWLLTDAK